MNLVDCGIKPGHCYIVAEVAQAHDGSLGTAHAYVDAAADAGADAVKFQTHIAHEESTLDEPWRVKFSKQDVSRFDYWRRMEFSESQWIELAQHCRERGIEFMSSPFSVAAVELLDRLEMRLWKIASGEIYNPILIDAILKTGKPVIYSTGMSDLDELVPLIDQTRNSGNDFAMLQCSTAYPCPPALWGLNVINEIKAKFDCVTGFSDHSGDIFAGLAAATNGASILELHITFSRQSFGPDVPASVTPEDLTRLVDGIRQINTAQRASPSKSDIAAETGGLKKIFGRSLALIEDLPTGTVIERKHLTLKKPAGGLPYNAIDSLCGQSLSRDKRAIELLLPEDFK